MHEDRLERLASRAPPGGLVVAHAGEIRSLGPVSSTDRFEIGSVTKLFTAQLLELLAADGVVRLDEPVGWGVGEHVTFERLANHRSGLPRTPRRAWRAFSDDEQPWRAFTVEDLRASLPPRVPRPRWFRYSNFGAALLGHALAERAEAPWEVLVKERIVEPLGLRDTGIDLPVRQPHRRGRPVPPWDCGAIAPAGALRSTAADLLRFLAESPALGWMREDGVLWHNGETGGSSSFVSRDPPVVLLANAAVAQRLTSTGLKLAGL